MKRILFFPARVTDFLSAAEYRGIKLVMLLLVFITALYSKEYSGPYQQVINNHIGGILYILFGSLLISIFRPSLNYWWPVIVSFSFISAPEFVQYLRMPFMVKLTENRVWALLLGVSFNPVDFAFYAGGALLSIIILMMLHARRRSVDAAKTIAFMKMSRLTEEERLPGEERIQKPMVTGR